MPIQAKTSQLEVTIMDKGNLDLIPMILTQIPKVEVEVCQLYGKTGHAVMQCYYRFDIHYTGLTQHTDPPVTYIIKTLPYQTLIQHHHMAIHQQAQVLIRTNLRLTPKHNNYLLHFILPHIPISTNCHQT